MFNKQMHVKTRCPECHTEYPLVPAALKATRGQARCAKCGHIFNAFEHRIKDPGKPKTTPEPSPPPKPTPYPDPYAEPYANPYVDGYAESAPTQTDSARPDPQQPMFAEDTARQHEDFRGGIRPWQVLLILLLGILLLAQIVWMNRATLLSLPAAQPLCSWIDCSIAAQRAPDSFQVVEREIRHDPLQQDVLHFKLRFRNDAAFAQPLPELLLHLFDSNEYLVARRRLQPHEYLPNSVTAGAKVQPGEIIDIALAFMDPGEYAKGFEIEFF